MVGHSVVWALTLSVLLWIAFPTSIAREAPGADCFRIACCFRSANNTATTTVNLWNYEDSTVGASGNCNDVSFEKNYRARVHPIGATNYICSSTASAQYLVRGTLADNGKSKHRAFRSSSFVFHVSGLKKVSKDASMPAGNNSGSYCLLQFLTGDISTVSAIEFQPLHPISSNMIKPSATSRKLMQALSNQDRSRFFLTIVVGCFMGISVLLLVLVVVVTTVCANKRQKKDSVVEAEESLKLPPKYIAKPVPEPELELKHMDKIQKFSLLELNVATNSFNNRIGEGGFGAVYHGILPDGQAIAVKVRSANSIQGLREFTTELTFLSDIRHDNLVPLIGVCTEQQILVYPYMSNGSLQDRLYGEAARRKPLDWITRLNIALGAARGLQFLHCTAGARCIIHRDVKSSNILLDNSMVSKVADFGFSKYAPQEGDSMVSLEVRGTAGYMDPEYYSTQQLTVKSDVFSFGVVLLEIICGREPLNIHRPRPEWSLVEWAKPFIVESNIQAIVDPAISSSYTPEAMWRVVEVALSSVESHGVHRPTMEGIIRELEDALIIETNASAYMASLDSTGSFRLSLSDSKLPPPMPLFYQFDPSPVFSETMGSPDPR